MSQGLQCWGYACFCLLALHYNINFSGNDSWSKTALSSLQATLLLHILTSAPIISSRHVRLFIWDGKNTHDAWWWRQDSHKHTPGGPSGTEIAARWQNRASHFGDFYHLLALLHISLCSLQIRSYLTDARQFSQSATCYYIYIVNIVVSLNYCMIVQLKVLLVTRFVLKRSFLCLPRQPKKYI